MDGRTTGGWLVAGWLALALAACGDDGVAIPDTATTTGTGAASSSSGDSVPTTSSPPITSEGGMTDGTASATDTPTTTSTPGTTLDPDTSGTTGGSSTIGTTGVPDTTGSTTEPDTGTETGVEVAGRSVSQTVNAGHLITSPGYRMVLTLGQPTQNQGTTVSPSYKLRGGLVGANGSPP